MNFQERRKADKCRVDRKTQFYLKYWPMLLSYTYIVVALFPINYFGNKVDAFYNNMALLIAILGILSSIFWKKFILRNLMTSIALARSVSVISVGIINEPHLPSFAIIRLSGAGTIALLFFLLAIVEIPYLKAMTHASG